MPTISGCLDAALLDLYNYDSKTSRAELLFPAGASGRQRQDKASVIKFHLDGQSGVSAYLQIAQQVKQALRLGLLQPGDQLPKVRDVVASLAINPNTVLKAYRELELEGLVLGRPGVGTFVVKSLAGPSVGRHAELRAEFVAWLQKARDAGLDDDSIAALIATTLREASAKATERPSTAAVLSQSSNQASIHQSTTNSKEDAE